MQNPASFIKTLIQVFELIQNYWLGKKNNNEKTPNFALFPPVMYYLYLSQKAS